MTAHRAALARAADAAAALWGLDAADIVGPARWPDLIPARFAVWAALHDAGMSWASIGRAARRDHTTVMYGAQQARKRAETDADYAAALALMADAARGNL